MKNGPYILNVAPTGYPGNVYRGKYAYEHHLAFWEHTKQVVPQNHIIHHVNHIKSDNRIENLQLLSKSAHSRLHHPEKNLKIRLLCAYCKDEFFRAPRNYNYKKNSGQTRFYCCRSHQVIDQQKRLKLASYSNYGSV
jgi:hypothetical protein